LTAIANMSYKPQTMKKEEAFLIDILTIEAERLEPHPELPVPYYGAIQWEKHVQDFTPDKEKNLFRRLHPSLQNLMRVTSILRDKHPSLMDPRRRWAILTASQLEKEMDQEHLRALESPRKVTPTAGLALTATGLNFLIARTLDIRFYQGESIAHACASGNHLLKMARDAIREGAHDVDPQCKDLNLVLESPCTFPGGYLLSLAAGFGGFHSAVVLEILP